MGKLIRISLIQIIIERGIPGCPWTNKDPPEGYIDEMWTTKVWQALAECNLQVQIETPKVEEERRAKDKCIMREINKIYKTESLCAVNNCRLWLHATYLSEITNSKGNKVEQWSLHGEKRLKDHQKWPNIGKTPKKDWEQWRKAIKDTFCNRKYELLEPLGKWYPIIDRKWE